MNCVYIGVDATNPTLILRIRSFLRAGVTLTGFTFRRQKFNRDFRPFWNNVHLGTTVDRRYLYRLPALAKGLWRMLRHGETFRRADFIYARNLDLAVLGCFAKYLTRSRAQLIYEVEDVQAVFFRPTLQGRIFRAIERWLLRRADLLVVMSPGFLRGYFIPTQNYDGPSYVLENRIQTDDRSLPEPGSREPWARSTEKVVIGWFGTLRCTKSMEILGRVADELGDKVEIYLRGYPTETGMAEFQEVLQRHPNWVYGGEYTVPDDLGDMYRRVHYAWCLDFLDAEGNSPLLLTCRMYQGGYYGAVPLVPAGSEMERWLAKIGIGHSIAPDYAENLIAMLRRFDIEDYRAERAEVMEKREIFREDGRDLQGLLGCIREQQPAKATKPSDRH
ncbi:glycosyltransferase [Sulfitobacter aestuarii]|uniref:Glycosyltransferase n=1 Tax=Sulfitobacter aestuarii TaxID=2161676 RepID=A0ABW5U3X6_9RHOB